MTTERVAALTPAEYVAEKIRIAVEEAPPLPAAVEDIIRNIVRAAGAQSSDRSTRAS